MDIIVKYFNESKYEKCWSYILGYLPKQNNDNNKHWFDFTVEIIDHINKYIKNISVIVANDDNLAYSLLPQGFGWIQFLWIVNPIQIRPILIDWYSKSTSQNGLRIKSKSNKNPTAGLQTESNDPVPYVHFVDNKAENLTPQQNLSSQEAKRHN